MLSFELVLDSDMALPVRLMKLFLCDLDFRGRGRAAGRPAESGRGASRSSKELPLALKQLNTILADKSYSKIL